MWSYSHFKVIPLARQSSTTVVPRRARLPVLRRVIRKTRKVMSRMNVLSTAAGLPIVCEFVHSSGEGVVRFGRTFQNLPTLGNLFNSGKPIYRLVAWIAEHVCGKETLGSWASLEKKAPKFLPLWIALSWLRYFLFENCLNFRNWWAGVGNRGSLMTQPKAKMS